MDDIFLTDKCVILVYPSGASGKLLSNCLSMHDDFILQSIHVKLTPLLRFEELVSKINNYDRKKGWDDLGLGDYLLFGNKNYNFVETPEDTVEQHQESFVKTKLNYYILKNMAKQGKHFFRACHAQTNYSDNYKFYRSMWPNAKQIYFYNTNNWIKFRNEVNFNFELKDEIDASLIEGSYFRWDCMSFADRDNFLKSYIKLIEDFNLTPQNLDKVVFIYDSYMRLYFNN
jgi:hypothetical protein